MRSLNCAGSSTRRGVAQLDPIPALAGEIGTLGDVEIATDFTFDRHHPVGHTPPWRDAVDRDGGQAGLFQERIGNQNLRQRQRYGVSSGDLQQPEEIPAIGTGTGAADEMQACLPNDVPECVRKLAALRRIQNPSINVIREYSLGRVRNQAVHQRNPSPRAITPRRISRVPPRSVNDGECNNVWRRQRSRRA